MHKYVYSARHNAFFPVDMIDKYKSEGWDLSDAKEVNQNIISEFMAEPPQGKIRIAGDDGLPAWADIPPAAAISRAGSLASSVKTGRKLLTARQM